MLSLCSLKKNNVEIVPLLIVTNMNNSENTNCSRMSMLSKDNVFLCSLKHCADQCVLFNNEFSVLCLYYLAV